VLEVGGAFESEHFGSIRCIVESRDISSHNPFNTGVRRNSSKDIGSCQIYFIHISEQSEIQSDSQILKRDSWRIFLECEIPIVIPLASPVIQLHSHRESFFISTCIVGVIHTYQLRLSAQHHQAAAIKRSVICEICLAQNHQRNGRWIQINAIHSTALIASLVLFKKYVIHLQRGVDQHHSAAIRRGIVALEQAVLDQELVGIECGRSLQQAGTRR
jgi:hypothetical protein